MNQIKERHKMNRIKERYIAAVLRSIPDDRRDDVDRELRTAIDDAIEARVEAGEGKEHAERQVLTDLGDPARLAADYSDRQLWLIGPSYYPAWLRMMKWLLKVILPVVVLANVGIRIAFGGSPIEAIFSGLWVAFIVALNVVLWSTVGFAVAERTDYVKETDIEPLTRWKLEHLPATTAPHRRFSLAETVGALAIQLVFVLILIAVGDSQPAGILDFSAWSIALPVMVGLLIASMAFRMVRYRIGLWTPALATINSVLNAAFAGWWWWALWNLRLFDPAVAERLGAGDWLAPTAKGVSLVILAVSAWDSIQGFVGIRQAKTS